MPTLALQFPIQQVSEYAARYTDDDDEVLAIARAVRDRGHYTLEEFRKVCRWKTPRSAPLVALNSANSVEATTRRALRKSQSDRDPIKELRSLHCVGLPTASVLLHLVYPSAIPSSTCALCTHSACRRSTATDSGSPTPRSIGV